MDILAPFFLFVLVGAISAIRVIGVVLNIFFCYICKKHCAYDFS